MKDATRSTRQFESATGLRRGDPMPTGGRFVGVSRGGVTWVSYAGDDFDGLCRLFDRSYAPQSRAA